MSNLRKAKALWEELGNIPINNNSEIEERFLHFDIGTFNEDIWHWFEDEFDLSIVDDLMYKIN